MWCTAMHCVALWCTAVLLCDPVTLPSHPSYFATGALCILPAIHCTTLLCIVLRYPALQYTVLWYTALQFTALNYTSLSFTALHCPCRISAMRILATLWATHGCLAHIGSCYTRKMYLWSWIQKLFWIQNQSILSSNSQTIVFMCATA